MMPLKLKRILVLSALLILSGCLEPYDPPVVADQVNFLVVDGFMNVADGSVNVTLSHATVLYEAKAAQPELSALVSIEDEDGNVSNVPELANGKYSSTESNF